MNNFRFILLSLSIILSATISFAEDQTQLFTFLKSTPSTTSTNVLGTTLFNTYLTGNEDELIKDIQCEHVRFINGKQGAILGTVSTTENGPYTSIKFIFNSEKIMKVEKITFYINSFEIANPKLELFLNGEKIAMPTKIVQKDAMPFKGVSATLTNIRGTGVSTSWISGELDSTPMQDLEIKNTYVDEFNDVQVLGFEVIYSGTTKDTETAVVELENEVNEKIEYYDLMGRALPAAPQSSIYIEKCGSKVTKRINR